MPVTTAIRYRGENSKTINPFIKQYVDCIRICNRKHYGYCTKNFGYAHNNFLYQERETYSLMAAAMHKLTPVHQSESNVIRRIDRRNPENRNRKKRRTVG